jgi:hypothetical protein
MMALLFNYAGHLRGACAGETKSGNHQSSLAILLKIRFRGGSGAELTHAALMRARMFVGRGRVRNCGTLGTRAQLLASSLWL